MMVCSQVATGERTARSAAARIDTQGVLPADTRHREISDFGQAGEGICTIHLPPGKPEIQ